MFRVLQNEAKEFHSWTSPFLEERQTIARLLMLLQRHYPLLEEATGKHDLNGLISQFHVDELFDSVTGLKIRVKEMES